MHIYTNRDIMMYCNCTSTNITVTPYTYTVLFLLHVTKKLGMNDYYDYRIGHQSQSVVSKKPPGPGVLN